MNGTDVYAFLENAFIATFLDELIPGIFHNFANPLNGIMGRSSLMQRRLTAFVRKIESRYPDIEKEMGEDYKKLMSDLQTINSESDKLFDMFRVSNGKFYAVGSHTVENVNLSGLIEAEMGFADFYLDFKHNVHKEIHLDHEMPDVAGVPAEYSMAFWALIRHAMKHIGKEKDKTFFIATGHDDQYVIVKMNHIDRSVFHSWRQILSVMDVSSDISSSWSDEQKSLHYPLLLLKMNNRGITVSHDEDTEMLAIRIPYRSSKSKV